MSEFGKYINVPSRKGVFIPDITVEMFRNASLEGVENLLASGEMEDISLPSVQPEDVQKIQDLEQAQFDKIRELAYQDGKADAMAEIIRCRECKHWKNKHLCESLSRYGSFETKADFYCGYAERRDVSK